MHRLPAGWCVFEEAAAAEVIGRSTRYVEGQRALDNISIAKVYNCDSAPPRPVTLEEPQDRAAVAARIGEHRDAEPLSLPPQQTSTQVFWTTTPVRCRHGDVRGQG